MSPKKVTAWAAMLAGLLSGLAGTAAAQFQPVPNAPMDKSQSYTWRNVAVIAGGFVDGLIFSPAREGLVFARTDIGGAYRWDRAAKHWVPLNDWAGGKDGNLLGCESIGVDPTNADRFYLALGTYTSNGSSNGAIVRTSDGGRTFKRTDVPFKMGGNEDGRSAGERLAVDPNNSSVLFMGSRNDGLWKSADAGATWAKVDSFPVTGRTNGIGVIFEIFDKTSGARGRATPIVYAAVSQDGPCLYRSTDSGATWQAIAGQPTGLLPHQGVLTSDGSLYLTYGNVPGPNGMSGGAVWKYDTKTSAWTDISPQKGGFGYAGLTVDRPHPQTVMVTTMDRWNPGDTLFRSLDGGKTWTDLGPKTVRDWSLTPYLTFGAPTARLGWWIGALALDPFHPGHAMYGTGATIFESQDVTNADTAQATHWKVGAAGLEETAVITLVSPPVGAHLISGLGDIGGFRHDDLSVSPAAGMYTNPTFTNTDSIDFAETNPMLIARVGRGGRGTSGAFSTDNGVTWTPFATAPTGSRGSGSIAVSADGGTLVWAAQGAAPAFSRDHGATWQASTAAAVRRATVVSDRVNAGTFYLQSGGQLLVSTDGGATFTPRGTLPDGARQLRATPGHTGDLWLAGGGNGVYHSTDGGVTFAHVGDVADAQRLGFGKAAPGRAYPALYVTGQTRGGASGVFRSDDTGQTWVRINDDTHQYGYSGQEVTGDPRIYGRVYMGTNGRGVFYADPTTASK
jgi:photosystem II stability/assembly factor-like uncharacterized protein